MTVGELQKPSQDTQTMPSSHPFGAVAGRERGSVLSSTCNRTTQVGPTGSNKPHGALYGEHFQKNWIR
jgi:hypothetical protein